MANTEDAWKAFQHTNELIKTADAVRKGRPPKIYIIQIIPFSMSVFKGMFQIVTWKFVYIQSGNY